MNSIRKILLLVAFTVCFICTSIGQTRPTWVNEIEISLNKGDWKTLYKRTYQIKESEKFHSIQIQMLHKEEINATVDINLKTSNKEAFDALKLTFDMLSFKKIDIKKTPVKIGDESLMYYGGSGWTHIIFRKGKVYADVMSQSEETTKLLAELLATMTPNKVK